MENQNIDILEQIHASYYQLTAAERKVADFALIQHAQIQFMSITQLADACGVGEATISRFCRSLMLKGFNAFKLELARHNASSSASKPSVPPESSAGRRQEIANLAVEAVQQTISLADPASVIQAVELIEQASKVMCFGSGSSMIMAEECVQIFSTVTGKFSGTSELHAQLSEVATMDPNGVIFLFSYSGATTNGLQVLELAKSRGIRSVLVTRFVKSPAAKLADVVLHCGSNETPIQFGSVPAKIAQLVIIDILFQEYYARNRAICDSNRQQIAAALSNIHL